MPGRERHAVAAGGASQSAGGEKGRREVDSVHFQGSSRSHGPLLLLGRGQPGESLHLRLRERYGLLKRRFLKHVRSRVSAGERRSKIYSKNENAVFPPHRLDLCVGVFARRRKKKGVF